MIARYNDERDDRNDDPIDFEPTAYMPTVAGKRASRDVLHPATADPVDEATHRQPNLAYSLLALVIGLLAMLLCTAMVLLVSYKVGCRALVIPP